MRSARARFLYVVTLSLVALTTLAPPAGAATPVLANEKFKWFYWIGFVLAASMALWLLRTATLYYVRVIRPKHRGRPSS